MQLTESLKSVFIETSKALRGSKRQLFMAQAVYESQIQRLSNTELTYHAIGF